MNDIEFFAEVADGFRETITRYPTNETYRLGDEYAQLYAIGYIDDALVLIVEPLPKTYPGVIFGLARHRWQLKPMCAGDGPYEIGQILAEEGVIEPGISPIPIRELNSNYTHWNNSAWGISYRVPHRPEEIQDFRWPRGFMQL